MMDKLKPTSMRIKRITSTFAVMKCWQKKRMMMESYMGGTGGYMGAMASMSASMDGMSHMGGM
jgi:hypothetical protein